MGKTDSRKETSFSKGTREGEMVGRHHQLDGHEFEQAPGVGETETWWAAVHEITRLRA